MEDIVAQPAAVLSSLQPEWPRSLLEEIGLEIEGSGEKVVILDDDPTGTQTTRDVPVLTHWSVEALAAELAGRHPAFFVLTNSRSMAPAAACLLAEEIGANLAAAAELTGCGVCVISRSDSTLRGHYPGEVAGLAASLGRGHLPHLVVPFFLEGGRVTLNDIHYVRENELLIPAAQTSFAADTVFGFANSDLRRWVAEKTGGAVEVSSVVSVSLEVVRGGGPEAVADTFCCVPDGGVCIVNCASYRDMEVVVRAVFLAEKRGRRFMARTAASYVRTRIGQNPDDRLLQKEEVVTPGISGGLFVVGSYVAKTGTQVERLLAAGGVEALELRVMQLLDSSARDLEVARITLKMNESLQRGRDTVVYTSRKLIAGGDDEESLHIGSLVSRCLIEIVRGLQRQPRYFVAKGGITSSDVATMGLGVKRAMIVGQIQPGVSVWQLGPEAVFPGMAYIVYPGNVGEADSLVEIRQILGRSMTTTGDDHA